MRGILKTLLRNTALKERLTAFRDRPPATYSQFAEDAYLSAFYRGLEYMGLNVDCGLFVDVGAYRPIHLSSSYAFYRRGWKCINIDATLGSMRIFDRVRPRDVNLEVAVGPQEGEMTYFLFGEPSVFNTMDAEMAALHRQTHNLERPREVPVRVRRLDSILAEHSPNLPFEVLNIDVEGYDLEVLKSNDFDRFRPRVILIESHGQEASSLGTCAASQYLVPLGYRIRSWLNPTLMFVRED